MNSKELRELLPTKKQIKRFINSIDKTKFKLRKYCHKCVKTEKFTNEKLIQLSFCPINCGCNNELGLDTAIAWNICNSYIDDISTFYINRTVSFIRWIKDNPNESILPNLIAKHLCEIIDDLEKSQSFIIGIIDTLNLHAEKYAKLVEICEDALEVIYWIKFPYEAKLVIAMEKNLVKVVDSKYIPILD